MISTHDSKYIFVGNDMGSIKQFDVEKKMMRIHIDSIHHSNIYSMAITPDNASIFISDKTGN